MVANQVAILLITYTSLPLFGGNSTGYPEFE